MPDEAIYHDHVARLRGALGRSAPMTSATEPHAAPSWSARPHIPCAWGDVFDRLSILELKCERVADPSALAHVRQERAALDEVVGDDRRFPQALPGLRAALAAVNAALWDVEDRIRACERAGRFDDDFVALAREVYRQNDRRAAIKREISLLLGSALIEEKTYLPSGGAAL